MLGEWRAGSRSASEVASFCQSCVILPKKIKQIKDDDWILELVSARGVKD